MFQIQRTEIQYRFSSAQKKHIDFKSVLINLFFNAGMSEKSKTTSFMTLFKKLSKSGAQCLRKWDVY